MRYVSFRNILFALLVFMLDVKTSILFRLLTILSSLCDDEKKLCLKFKM